MSSDHTYPSNEISSQDPAILEKRLTFAGLTPETVVLDSSQNTLRAVVSEDAVSAVDLKAALNTVPGALSSNFSSIEVLGDGAATFEVPLLGPPFGVVNIEWEGVQPVSTRQVTLDAQGHGSFVVGPFTGRTGNGWALRIVARDAAGQMFGLVFTVTVT